MRILLLMILGGSLLAACAPQPEPGCGPGQNPRAGVAIGAEIGGGGRTGPFSRTDIAFDTCGPPRVTTGVGVSFGL